MTNNGYLNREYTVGEKRLIEWQIRPNSKSDIVIVSDARYEVCNSDGVVVKSGKCDVSGLKVGFLFEADTAGTFTARIFVTVPPEIVEAEITCEVS